MARQAIVVHVDHGKTSLTAAITKVLAEHASDDLFEVVAADTQDYVPLTPKEMVAMGLKTRGTKRDDIPRPKDQYHQRRKGARS